MTKASPKKAEVLKFLDVFEEIVSLLRPFHHPILSGFVDRWGTARERYIQELTGGTSASKLADGLRQALRDYSDFLEYIPPDNRREFVEKYTKIVTDAFPDFYRSDERKINSIIQRGKIRNENEFYLIESVFEQLHRANPDGEDSVALRKIMDDFEFGKK